MSACLLSTSPSSSNSNSARGMCPNRDRYALETLYCAVVELGADVEGGLVDDSQSESEKSSRSVITIPVK
jgi:hypothetical protein